MLESLGATDIPREAGDVNWYPYSFMCQLTKKRQCGVYTSYSYSVLSEPFVGFTNLLLDKILGILPDNSMNYRRQQGLVTGVTS